MTKRKNAVEELDKELLKQKEAEKKEEVVLTPAEYFEEVKSRIKDETPENVALLFNTTLTKLQKYKITGQKKAAKLLYAKALYLEKEYNLLTHGVTKYVLRSDVEQYIQNIANDCVVLIELENYERDIPDDICEKVASVADYVDKFFVCFTDYTGETRSKVAQEKREKDPILFASIFEDGRVSPKLYFIGDWVDDYCDLTLDRMIGEIAKKEKKDESKIVFDINDLSTLDKIEEELMGTNTRKTSRKENKKEGK